MPYEIRIRDAAPDLQKPFEAIQKEFGKKQRSDVVEMLIRRYAPDQQIIKEVQKRNSELSTIIRNYENRESQLRDIIEDMIIETRSIQTKGRYTERELTTLLKKYSKKPAKRSKKPAAKKPKPKKKK